MPAQQLAEAMHKPVAPTSFLFLTLDSCRYDTFVSATTPNLDRVGELHLAMAPANYTYASHAAMFTGFTPGVFGMTEPFVNPKFGRIFKMARPEALNTRRNFVTLEGANIVDGFRRLGHHAIGTGAAGWFDPEVPTAHVLTRFFDSYFYPGNPCSLRRQLEFVHGELDAVADGPVFVFVNIGETHVPYYHEGASWSPQVNPCVPFATDNDAAECRRRQRACLEWVDAELGPLLNRFAGANMLVCADHGDAWGEGGLWEHGIHHQKVLEVPLLLRLPNPPITA
jgi:hypothetical protein